MGLRYRKGQGLKKNMKPADEIMDSYRKQRSGYGVSTGLLASALIRGMTSNLSQFDDLKKLKQDFGDVFNTKNNYPYSEEYLKNMRNKGRETFENALKDVVDKTRELNIGSEASSMNEGLRAARQNVQEDKKNTKTEEVK